jgi:NADH-quinone oxidoreductase subunit H
MCAMINILFLGGWHLPWGPVDAVALPAWMPGWLSWLSGLPGFIVFWIKVWLIFFVFAMVKAIVPRYRYDQLMRLGWKIFLPTSLVAVAAIAYYVTFMAPPGAQHLAGG